MSSFVGKPLLVPLVAVGAITYPILAFAIRAVTIRDPLFARDSVLSRLSRLRTGEEWSRS